MKNSSKSKKTTDKQYEDLGRIVASVYETGYLDKASSYKHAFFKGIFTGLGGVIGATLLIALLLWVLSLFNSIPFVGRITETLEDTIQSNKR